MGVTGRGVTGKSGGNTVRRLHLTNINMVRGRCLVPLGRAHGTLTSTRGLLSGGRCCRTGLTLGNTRSKVVISDRTLFIGWY